MGNSRAIVENIYWYNTVCYDTHQLSGILKSQLSDMLSSAGRFVTSLSIECI
jgi:hypothetical protein